MVVASFGGGVNSTAMLIGCYERSERPDLILFADTGGEKRETYRHIEIFSEWLVKHGMPEIVTVRANGKTLEQDCLDRNALPAIAYGLRTCSLRWKVEPQEQYILRQGITEYTKLIGFDAGEWHRIRDGENNRYPLVEWRWFRRECVEAIERVGLCVPPKSSCYFCPMNKKHEIRQLRLKHPELLQRAIEMEKNAELTTIKGLGVDWSWEKFAQADEAQDPLFPDAFAERPCTCMDGE